MQNGSPRCRSKWSVNKMLEVVLRYGASDKTLHAQIDEIDDWDEPEAIAMGEQEQQAVVQQGEAPSR